MRYVLDTHAALWLAFGDGRLSAAALSLMGKLGPKDLVLSDVSLSEAGRLLKAGRLSVQQPPLDWMLAFGRGFTVVPVSPPIAWKAADYEWAHRDPYDRHILATAQCLGLPLVTCDAEITPFARGVGVRVLW